MPQSSTHYSPRYFSKFKKNNGSIKNVLLTIVDRKGPVLPYLQSLFPRHAVLVDFGCGNGLFGTHAVKHFAYTGVDFSKEALAEAKRRIKMGTFLCGSIDQLKKMKANSVDVVTCFDVLEHVDNHPDILSEFRRILKPSGRLVVSVPIADSLALVQRTEHWLVFEDTSHIRIFSRSEWESLLRHHGLLPIKRWSSGIINTPTKPFSLPLWMMPVHLLTQAIGLLGLPLPARYSDVDFFVAIKNPHFDN